MTENKDIAKSSKNQSPTEPNGSSDLVSLARRRVMKAGVSLAPVILTLRGRALFGKNGPNANSVTLSANASRGIVGGT
jgi:hypothetical protein